MAGPFRDGAVAQLGEHRLCMAGVGGSNPPGSTIKPGGKAAENDREGACQGAADEVDLSQFSEDYSRE